MINDASISGVLIIMAIFALAFAVAKLFIWRLDKIYGRKR